MTDVVHGDTHCTRCVLEMLQGVMGVVHSGTYLYRCILDTSRCDKCCTWQHILRLGVLEILHGVTDVHGNTYLTRCILEMLQGETDDVHRDTYLIRCVPQMFQAVTHAAHADLPTPHSVLSNLPQLEQIKQFTAVQPETVLC